MEIFFETTAVWPDSSENVSFGFTFDLIRSLARLWQKA